MSIPVSGVQLVVRPEVAEELTEIAIQRYNEQTASKVVQCWINGSVDPITLWAGDAYDAIGQWTDTQAYGVLSGMAASGTSPFRKD
jgi:hypothetical protein